MHEQTPNNPPDTPNEATRQFREQVDEFCRFVSDDDSTATLIPACLDLPPVLNCNERGTYHHPLTTEIVRCDQSVVVGYRCGTCGAEWTASNE